MIKKFFDNINLKSFIILFIIYCFATVLCQFGIALFYTCSLGADPISIFVEGACLHINLTLGQFSTVCNVILSILTIIFERRNAGFGLLIQMAISGPLIDLFYPITMTWFPPETTTFILKIIILLFAILIYSFGLALTILCQLGIAPFSFPPLFLADITPIKLRYTQIITDAIWFIIGIILGGTFGFGTIITVLLTGPCLGMFMKLCEKYILKIGFAFKDQKQYTGE